MKRDTLYIEMWVFSNIRLASDIIMSFLKMYESNY